ncbi:hypothetical protein BKA67DRAFT_328902 [Truncatella angustata]|uniref:Protein kinase domain-containing protein n=1 Tax=Truncatella angustata TaxID=152316 RepID=A0A9P8ZWG7_9PEZI|nr:uncharacterized protein BKA67DRAFT_328902 [Truncatella angustata]KAH6653685.1 hypothetical protein BKA67DRAFT_328902 [Truncatella angustata]
MPQIDLVRDSKLETEFRDDCTIHTFIEPSGRNRRISWTEYWRFEKQNIGRGGFGQVQLERCVNGKRKDMIRAVKIINKPSGSTKKKPMEFERELEAIAKFSQKRSHSAGMKTRPQYSLQWSIVLMATYAITSLSKVP